MSDNSYTEFDPETCPYELIISQPGSRQRSTLRVMGYSAAVARYRRERQAGNSVRALDLSEAEYDAYNHRRNGVLDVSEMFEAASTLSGEELDRMLIPRPAL